MIEGMVASMAERLQKILAAAGFGSRRACESIIMEGRVKINGAIVRDLGVKADPRDDIIEVDGNVIRLEKKVYLMLHKPPGYVTTVRDPQGRPTVMDLIPDVSERVFPVGRLDYDAEGLLFLTNDGGLAQILTHPKWEVDKTYIARVEGIPDEQDLERLRTGVDLDGHVSAPASADILKRLKGSAILRITIHEGRKHQVKDMCRAVGHPVLRLKRVKFGPLSLGRLGQGRYRHLSHREIRDLMRFVDKARERSKTSRPDIISVGERLFIILGIIFGITLIAAQSLIATDFGRRRLVPLERLEGVPTEEYVEIIQGEKAK